MAAPMISKSQANTTIRGKFEKKKKRKPKNIVCSSLNFTWPKVESSAEEAILEKMKSTIEPLRIAKIHRNKRDAEKPVESNENSPGISEKTEVSLAETDYSRRQIVIGINAVTKGLEKDIFSLVLTCSSTQPPVLTQHLIGLAASRACPVLQISGLNKTLSSLMNFKSAVAVGFKKCSEEKSIFNELVSFILKYAEIPKLPWIDYMSVLKEDRLCVKDSEPCAKGSEGKKGIDQTVKDEELDKKKTTEVLYIEGNKTDVKCEKNVHEESEIMPNATTVTTRKCDYSRFYVYKSDTKGITSSSKQLDSGSTDVRARNKDGNDSLGKQVTDVLGLGDIKQPSSSCEPENKKGQKRKYKESNIKFVDFQPAHIMQVFGNENRKKKVLGKPKKKKIKK